MAHHSFTFINRTGNPKSLRKTEEDMPTIRSHAMRYVRRRRESALKVALQSDIATKPSKTSEDNDSRRRMSLCLRSSAITCNRTFSSFQHGTAIGSNGVSAEVLDHLHYFVLGFKPRTFPITYIRHHCDIPRIALSQGNVAVLHALCALSSMHQTLVRGTTMADKALASNKDQNKITRLYLYHKHQAIVSLQVELSSSGVLDDPSSMATVALLLLMESFSGDTVTSNTHRRGFVELVDRFGRPHKASDLMSSDVLMTDIKSATSSLTQPTMKPCESWSSELDRLGKIMFVPHRMELLSLGSGFMTTEVRDSLEPALIELLRAMRNLINGVEQNFDMGIDVSEVTGVHVLVLEHSLLCIQPAKGKKNVRGSNISEYCRIACLVYCNLCLWTWQRNTTLLKNLVSYLQTAIELWNPGPLCDEQHSLLLWLYFVGSFAAENSEGRAWAIRGMNDVSRVLDIKNEEDFGSVMASFFYVDRLMGQHLVECYDEISNGPA